MFVRNGPNKLNRLVRCGLSAHPRKVEIMSSPLPLRPPVDHAPRERLTVEFGSDRSEAVFDALGSETARSVVDFLECGPAPASDIAKQCDISIQTVSYHLDNLVDAGLVTDAGTWYSSKGTEMNVYAVAGERIEMCLTSDEADVSRRSTFERSSSTDIALNDD